MSLCGLFTVVFAGKWWCEERGIFSWYREGEKKKYLPKAGFTCRPLTFLCACVWGEASFKCVNPFFLVAVAGPPSCLSPHIITIHLLPLHPGNSTLHPQPIQSLGLSSKNFTVLQAIWTHTYTNVYMCVVTHSTHHLSSLPIFYKL